MSYSGNYKEIRFRSILELSVIRHFEKQGFILGKDMFYESVAIQYGKKKIRNYIVDLSFPKDKLLVEIKPSSRADNKNNKIKREAAEKWCSENSWTYVIITEEELKQCDEILTLVEAAKINDVKLGERSKRALRKIESKKKRKEKKNEKK